MYYLHQTTFSFKRLISTLLLSLTISCPSINYAGIISLNQETGDRILKIANTPPGSDMGDPLNDVRYLLTDIAPSQPNIESLTNLMDGVSKLQPKQEHTKQIQNFLEEKLDNLLFDLSKSQEIIEPNARAISEDITHTADNVHVIERAISLSNEKPVIRDFLNLFDPVNISPADYAEPLSKLARMLETAGSAPNINTLENLYTQLSVNEDFWINYLNLVTGQNFVSHEAVDHVLVFLKNKKESILHPINDKVQSKLEKLRNELVRNHDEHLKNHPNKHVSPYTHLVEQLDMLMESKNSHLPMPILLELLKDMLCEMLPQYVEIVEGQQFDFSSKCGQAASELKVASGVKSTYYNDDQQKLGHEIALIAHHRSYDLSIAIALIAVNINDNLVSDHDRARFLDHAQFYFNLKHTQGVAYIFDNVKHDGGFLPSLFNIPISIQPQIKSFKWTDQSSNENVHALLRKYPGPFLLKNPEHVSYLYSNESSKDNYMAYPMAFETTDLSQTIATVVNVNEIIKVFRNAHSRILVIECPHQSMSTEKQPLPSLVLQTVEPKASKPDAMDSVMHHKKVGNLNIQEHQGNDKDLRSVEHSKQTSTTSDKHDKSSGNVLIIEDPSKVEQLFDKKTNLEKNTTIDTPDKPSTGPGPETGARPKDTGTGARPKDIYMHGINTPAKTPSKINADPANRTSRNSFETDINLSIFQNICNSGDLQKINIFLNNNKDFKISNQNVLALHMLCLGGHVDAVKDLLARGLNTNFSGTGINLFREILNLKLKKESEDSCHKKKAQLLELLVAYGMTPPEELKVLVNQYIGEKSSATAGGLSRDNAMKTTHDLHENDGKVVASNIPQPAASNIAQPVTSQNDETRIYQYVNSFPYDKYKKNPNKVEFFHRTAPNYIFSNFSTQGAEKGIVIDGKTWKTTEHYFQAQKFEPNGAHYNEILTKLQTGKEVLQYARDNIQHSKHKRYDWENIKLSVMLKALRNKAQQNPTFRQALIKTGSLPIFETSDQDDFWGTNFITSTNKHGKNVLGATLMVIRDEINQGNLLVIKKKK